MFKMHTLSHLLHLWLLIILMLQVSWDSFIAGCEHGMCKITPPHWLTLLPQWSYIWVWMSSTGLVVFDRSRQICVQWRHLLSSPPDEEPEEDLSVEEMEEKAKAGDARAQTRVSESTCTQTSTWHCFRSYWWTQSGCEHASIFGHLEDDPGLSIWYTKILSLIQIIMNTITVYCSTALSLYK